jgi:hypothetical protein
MNTEPLLNEWDIDAVLGYERFTGFVRLMKVLRSQHPELYAEYQNTLRWAKTELERNMEDELGHGEQVFIETEQKGINIFEQVPELRDIWAGYVFD